MLFLTSLLASLACTATASLLITKPIASTTCSATLACTVSWKDSGAPPSLASIGPSTIDLCRGTTATPVCGQRIASALDVSKNSSVVYYPAFGLGPTGDYYLIKFTSLGSASTVFSDRFTLVGMGGQYVASIDGVAATQTGSKPITMSVTPTLTQNIAGATTLPPASSGIPSVIGKDSGAVPMVNPRIFASAMGVTLIIGMSSVYFGMLLFAL